MALDLRRSGVPGCLGHLYCRRSLFEAIRSAKVFDVLSCADKRFLGHLRGLASESLDRFDCRGHSLERDMIYRIIDVSVGGIFLRALLSHRFLKILEI
jgi:hypothetical protein